MDTSLNKTLLGVLAGLGTALVAALVLGRRALSKRYSWLVTQLFTNMQPVTGTFTYEQLADLPAPVQRYFRFALPDGYPLITSARLRHGGQIKVGENWQDIQGEEYFTINPPGYVWRGRMSIATGVDYYVQGEGGLFVGILGAIPVVDATGENYNQGELMRLVTELTVFPTALLPSDALRWLPVDETHARLLFKDHKVEIDVLVEFADDGRIISFEGERYRDTATEAWGGYCAEYHEMNGVQVPTYFEAAWKPEGRDEPYVRFKITEIEYNKPQRYS